jgi:hypothetical protein
MFRGEKGPGHDRLPLHWTAPKRGRSVYSASYILTVYHVLNIGILLQRLPSIVCLRPTILLIRPNCRHFIAA